MSNNSSYIIPRDSSNDRHLTGFYTTKNSQKLHLRVQESNQVLEGIIRLNKSNIQSENVFEGFNGKRWVKFNAIQGEKGDTGDNFSKLFKFQNTTNLKEDQIEDKNSILENYGLIFKTLELDTNETNKKNEKSIISVRSLSSDIFNINGKEYKSMNIKTVNNEILLDSNPKPYKWNFSDIKLSEYKSNSESPKFKAYGEISSWKVKSGVSICKGQAVRLDYKTENDYLVIIPLEYSSSVCLNLFNNPKQFLGIALEDSESKDKIDVCTYGITTVKCNINNSFISSEFMTNNNITEIGLSGLVSSCGLIFNSPIKPLNDYIKAGYFLETKQINENNQYLLFFIE